MSTTSRAEAAAARAAAVQQRSHKPRERRSSPDEPRAQWHRVRGQSFVQPGQEFRETTRNGLVVVPVGGKAYTSEQPYEMYDVFGPYTEIVSRGASARTLAAAPRVEYVLNHNKGGGAPMALTENDMLVLAEDATGLDYTAYVDPERTDVADMLRAIKRRDLTQSSFKFWITAGVWSPDYTEYRINEIDLDGGDVSSVNFGANPNAWTELRSAPVEARRAAARRALRGVARSLTARALAPAEATALATLLLEITAAEAMLDPIVDALCAADCALDNAETTLAALLGLPLPADDEMPMDPGTGPAMDSGPAEAAAGGVPAAGLLARLDLELANTRH